MTFAQRYEAACKLDGTLRVTQQYRSETISLQAVDGRWRWIGEDGCSRMAESEHDAIAHATVAMIRWLASMDLFPRIDNPSPLLWIVSVRQWEKVIVGEVVLQQLGDTIFEARTLHDCLIAAVEKVLDHKDKTKGTE